VAEHFDVAVVGAGPAGSAAALTLARGGARAVILEREALPRYKTCGGGLVYRATQLAGIDLSPVIERRFPEAALYLPDTQQRFTAQRPFPIISTTMRARLDQFLADAAVAAGAELRAPCRVRHGSVGVPGVELDTDGGRLTADVVIGADGALGETARWAGWEDARDRGHLAPALEYEVTADAATMDRVGRELRFDIGSPPAGYAWVFPKGHGLSIGVFSTRRGIHDLRRHADAYLAARGVTPRAIERHGYVIPLRPRRRVARGPVLLAGDAAGLADPLTAEGISNALASGALAAHAVIMSGGEPTRLGRNYTGALRQEILPELARGRRAAMLLYRSPAVRDFLFRRLGQVIVEGVTGIFTGERPYRGAAVAAARRLARSFV
jgi:geranylgeranyl reductase family protein